ncbi:MAG: dihydropteroate synthase [Chitinophagaceae bacterium]|nr:dihydropteroate synthase [Chitinophagaceae bacterium]
MYLLNCRGRLLNVDKPMIMGIINTTPDSFFAPSRRQMQDELLSCADEMLKAGAAILDMGGQSTRPGSRAVEATEEMDRVVPAIEAVHRHFPDAIISVDTYYARVAEMAVQAGASIVNDISAGRLDEDLLSTVARLRVPYILMHMAGTPQHMQDAPHYTNVVQEVMDFFIAELARLQQLGITDVILDPGFGFGKTIAHNFQLLRQLELFQLLHRPLLLGVSRKSTIYKTLGTTAAQALNGTTVLHTVGLQKGAQLLRVHDVKEAREAVLLLQAMENA